MNRRWRPEQLLGAGCAGRSTPGVRKMLAAADIARQGPVAVARQAARYPSRNLSGLCDGLGLSI
jgi:hypothetical protein